MQKKASNGKFAEEWITEYVLNGGKTLREIKTFLEGKKIIYADNRGLVNVLNKAIQDKKIWKEESSKVPIYRIHEKEAEKISFKANIFANFASNNILNLKKFRKSTQSEKEFVIELIQKCGFYMVFAMLYGWDLALDSKSKKRQEEIVQEWLPNILKMPTLPTHFNLEFSALLDDKNRMRYHDPPFEPRNIKKKMLKKIQKTLGELYSEEFAICNDIRKNVTKLSKETSNLHVEIKVNEDIVKKSRAKMKNSKN